jgi:HlyD family secretion protein
VPLLVVLALVGCGGGQASPTTVKVTRADVESLVDGTGSLRTISEKTLGFPTAGKLVDLKTVVGMPVKAGQVLARLDDFPARTELARAQARLTQEQAQLSDLSGNNKAKAARDDQHGADQVLGATKDQADDASKADDDAVDRAEREVSDAQDGMDRARNLQDAAEERCQNSLGRSSGRGRSPMLLEPPVDMRPLSCRSAEDGGDRVEAAQRRLDFSEAVLDQAKRRRDLDRDRQRVSVENARRDATAARDEASGALASHPHLVAEQVAAVALAQSDVSEAQRAVDDCVLTAPVDGTVASINGSVGEFIGPASGTTAQAPGADAPLPDAASGVSGKDSDGSKAQRPGGSAFIVLANVHSFQVVVPFEEADAAKLALNQRAEVRFDAVPGLIRSATVASIAPTGATIQDVTNYYVTLVLNEVDARLKDGLTAEAGVVVGEAHNVLVVPNVAIQRGGQTGVVTVMAADGIGRRVQVRLGMVGDTTTEIKGGLVEGQRVLVAQPG